MCRAYFSALKLLYYGYKSLRKKCRYTSPNLFCFHGYELMRHAKTWCVKWHHLTASFSARLLIVMKAVQSANSSNNVLVGDDTDLLILLCHHASIESHDLFICPEPKKTTKQPHIWNIKVTKQSLGPDICQHIFFLYAVLGCDTTYRLHRIGKGASLKKFQASHSFRQHAKVLLTHSASKHDVTCT